jgi:CTP-dependent riboflavin kinase
MKSLRSKPLITREEFQQGRILVEELGLLSDMPPDIVQLSSVVKDIIINTKVVKGIREGDYYSLIIFSTI